MQGTRGKNYAPGIFKRYAMMYSAYFKEGRLITDDSFMDVKFEELEKDQSGQIEKILQQLNVKYFKDLKSDLEKYVASIAD